MPLIRPDAKIGESPTKMMFGGSQGPAAKGGKGLIGMAKIVLSGNRMSKVLAMDENSEWRKLKVRNEVFKLESQALMEKEKKREERMKSLLMTVGGANKQIFHLGNEDDEDAQIDWSNIATKHGEHAIKITQEWDKLGLDSHERFAKFAVVPEQAHRRQKGKGEGGSQGRGGYRPSKGYSSALPEKSKKKTTVAVGFTDHGSQRASRRAELRALQQEEEVLNSSHGGSRDGSPAPRSVRAGRRDKAGLGSPDQLARAGRGREAKSPLKGSGDSPFTQALSGGTVSSFDEVEETTRHTRRHANHRAGRQGRRTSRHKRGGHSGSPHRSDRSSSGSPLQHARTSDGRMSPLIGADRRGGHTAFVGDAELFMLHGREESLGLDSYSYGNGGIDDSTGTLNAVSGSNVSLLIGTVFEVCRPPQPCEPFILACDRSTSFAAWCGLSCPLPALATSSCLILALTDLTDSLFLTLWQDSRLSLVGRPSRDLWETSFPVANRQAGGEGYDAAKQREAPTPSDTLQTHTSTHKHRDKEKENIGDTCQHTKA